MNANFCTPSRRRLDIRRCSRLATGLLVSLIVLGAHAGTELVLDTKDVSNGLFPELPCEQLRSAGFQCMSIAAPQRFVLSTTPFRAGSAELTPALKGQLDIFASVLRDPRSRGKTVTIEGHSEPSEERTLSLRRADAAKVYLVDHGVDAAMLTSTAADNDAAGSGRRIEIERAAKRR